MSGQAGERSKPPPPAPGRRDDGRGGVCCAGVCYRGLRKAASDNSSRRVKFAPPASVFDDDDLLAGPAPTHARLRFLGRWARLQLSLIDVKYSSPAKVARQRAIVDHIISAAAPCLARLSAEGSSELTASLLGVGALVNFLEKEGVAQIVEATNALSAKELEENPGALDDADAEALRVWYSKVLPALAALSHPRVGLAASSPCRDLATWSQQFRAEHPAKSGRSVFRLFSPRSVSRTPSAMSYYQSCLSDSEQEAPPDGAEDEIEHESDSDLEGDKMFESFLSARTGQHSPGGGILQMLGLVDGPGIESWEFARGAKEHGWEDTDGTQIHVRGPNFLSDKAKQPSAPSMFEAVQVDLFDAAQAGGYPNVAACPGGVVAELRKAGEKRFLFVVNFCMAPLHLVGVFAPKDAPEGGGLPPANGDPARELLRRFVEDMTDAERSQRFKVIPWVREGPWLVQKAVGKTPAIIGKSLKIDYFSAPNDYFEVSVNIFSSSAAQRILNLLKGAAKTLVMDVYFVLEGKSPQELPEHILGGFQVARGDLARTRGPV